MRMIDSDLISRQVAIDAMENVDWYHINKDGRLIHGANSEEDEPLYKAEDIYNVLEQLPSAEPDLSCNGCKHLGEWDNEIECGYNSPCTNCTRRVIDNYER